MDEQTFKLIVHYVSTGCTKREAFKRAKISSTEFYRKATAIQKAELNQMAALNGQGTANTGRKSLRDE